MRAMLLQEDKLLVCRLARMLMYQVRLMVEMLARLLALLVAREMEKL